MIYPTRRTVILAALGAPAALVAGVAAPQLWVVGPVWLLAIAALAAVDLLGAPGRKTPRLVDPPTLLGAVGRTETLEFAADFGGASPRQVEGALAADPRLGLHATRRPARREGETTRLMFTFTPLRRGDAGLERLELRWTGPLGLLWRQRGFALAQRGVIATDLRRLRDEALAVQMQDALFGAKAQIQLGSGSEFHALRAFAPGMDRRSVDWKQSARHATLLSRENRTERNHQVMVAIDCGRAMSDPIGDAPRIDRAVLAGLLLGFQALRGGDRVGLFAYDSAPRVSVEALSGQGAFNLLQKAAARVDYSAEETNHTLGLATLTGLLQRRSLVVVFSEFTDPTSAGLLVEAVGRLLRRHLILFVVMRDDDLEAIAAAPPAQVDDISRAVVADGLLRERQAVLTRLRRMGAHVVEAPADRLGPAVLNAYLDLKRRELL